MRINYLQGIARTPQPSLRGGLERYRPIIAVRITGPGGSWILDGLLDPGSDDTVFPEWAAPMIGVDLDSANEQYLHLAGRGKTIRCRYASVMLRITDGRAETYEWEAIVGFVAVPLKCPLLGHAGFLEYFDVTFRGADHAAILTANASLPNSGI